MKVSSTTVRSEPVEGQAGQTVLRRAQQERLFLQWQ